MKPLLNILIGLMFSMSVFADTSMSQEPADDLLAGPSVQDEVVTDEDMRKEKLFRSKDGMKRQEQNQMRMWLRTLQSLDLTEDQQTEIQSLLQKLQESQEKFQKEHGKEMKELRRKSNEAKKNGTDIPEDVGTRTRELLALAPDTTKYLSQAWKLLNETQHAEFLKKYQATLEAMQKRRGDQKDKGDGMRGDQDERPKGFGLKDSPIQDRQRDNRQVDAQASDDSSLRRIRFLRRLHKLNKDR